MLRDITVLLLETLTGLLGSTLLLRAYLAWLRVPRANPLSQFCFGLSDWMVLPLRRVIPVTGRLDTACLIGAVLVGLFDEVVVALISLPLGLHAGLVVVGVVVIVLRWTLHLTLFLLIVNAVLSLVNPHAPLAPVFDVLTRPWLNPLRRYLPRTGAIDLSPMAAVLIIMVLLAVLDRFPG